MIQSALLKLLESRFLPPLKEYLSMKLDRSQTRFVPRMGTQVNIARALKQIHSMTLSSRTAYGLFIDFSNAYNTVPHTLLFEKLQKKNIFPLDELEFLKQLYARYHIRVGNSSFRPNKGVAQGSIISPALFDIFIEDLSEELQKKCSLSLTNILLYADDIMVICNSKTQLEQAIKVIEDWTIRNGMLLNKKKSGILTFGARKQKKNPYMECQHQPSNKYYTRVWTPSLSDIMGIPLCKEYKYLGVKLTPKLNLGPQIAFIEKKSTHIFT